MRTEPSAEDLFVLVGNGPRIQNVLDGLSGSPSSVSDDDATVARALRARVTDVAVVFDLLAAWGWLERPAGGRRRLRVDGDTMRELAARFRGMVDGVHLTGRNAPEVIPIVTLPKSSEALRAVVGEDIAASFETRDGFAHVISRATERVVILAPFIDAVGAEAVAGMLAPCPAKRKVLICRPDAQRRRYHLRFVERLADAGAEVREYWHPRPEGARPTAETFHAKMVMADRDLVYVGSSNLLSASLDGGLECGVLLEGVHARPFRRIVEGVLAVSDPLPAENPLPA